MNGGNLTVHNSSVGLALGQTGDTTHCDQHFGGVGNVISVTHTNLSTSSYGIMFYGGTGADFTYDNWVSNSTNVDAQPGVSGDFSYSYFQRGAPVGVGGATITAGNLAVAMLPACTGANAAMCAGPNPRALLFIIERPAACGPFCRFGSLHFRGTTCHAHDLGLGGSSGGRFLHEAATADADGRASASRVLPVELLQRRRANREARL